MTNGTSTTLTYMYTELRICLTSRARKKSICRTIYRNHSTFMRSIGRRHQSLGLSMERKSVKFPTNTFTDRCTFNSILKHSRSGLDCRKLAERTSSRKPLKSIMCAAGNVCQIRTERNNKDCIYLITKCIPTRP